jgi:hypothetical protein
MISTVTTTTVALLTDPAFLEPLGLIGALTLLALLVQKQILAATHDARMERVRRVMNIAILPLLAGFLLIVLQKMSSILQF